MKLKEGFLLRKVAGENVALPVGGDMDQNIMITLNGTAAFLWERLAAETDTDALVAAVLAEYEVDEPTARNAVEGFLQTLRGHGFLEE